MHPVTAPSDGSPGEVTRIDQLLPTLSSRDAIGEHVLHVQRALRATGYRSDVYFGDASPDRLDAGRPVSRIGDQAVQGRVLLYHLSIGSPVSRTFRDRPERKFVYYHNITPAHFFAPWLPDLAAQVAAGRSQLQELASVTEFALASSAFNERELVDAGYPVTATAPLLMDVERFTGSPDPVVAARLAAARAGGGTDLLFVGKVSPHKGQADLVRALSAYRAGFDPSARLHLVGGSVGGEYQQAVQALAAELGMDDAVEFTGSVTHEELIAYYQGCDVFVCLSGHEGLCVPLVEAMFHRLPIVAWDRAGVPETVQGAGVVLSDKDPVLVATAVDRVVRDARLRRSLAGGAAGRLAWYSLARTSGVFLRTVEAAVHGGSPDGTTLEPDRPAGSDIVDRARLEIEDEAGRRRSSGVDSGTIGRDLDARFARRWPTDPYRTADVPRPLTVATALGLLFPTTPPARLDALAARWGAEAEVRSPSDLRLLLGSVDHDAFASPVEVHFGRDDVVVVQVDGISLALDRHDHAISRPIIDGTGHDPWLADIATDHCRPGMTVVDVGANVGYFTMLAWAAVGDGGRVVAVEPRSDNCRLLLLSAGLNGAFTIELLPVAADRTRGLAHLGVAIGTNGGFVPDDPRALLDGSAVVVPTFPLDEVVDGPVHLIKVDVEGAEGRVMDGAASIISTHRPIVVTELSPTMLATVSGCTCEEYLTRFDDLGYDLSEIDPVGRTTGPAEGIAQLMARWGSPDTIRNLLLLPRPARG